MMKIDDDYRVYMVPLPGDINGAVTVDADGYPSVYINDLLSPEARRRALAHELHHIVRDDLYNDLPITEVECATT